MRGRPHRGFTLVELLIALAIVGALVAIAFGGLRVAVASWRHGEERAEAHQHVRSVALILARAFGGLGLHRVEANVQPGNTASLRLVLSSGFRCEGYAPRLVHIDGRWRDHVRFAIDLESWREHAPPPKRARAPRRPQRSLPSAEAKR